MQSFTVASLLALVGSAVAQTSGFHAINLPGQYEEVPACTTYNIKWTPSTIPSHAGPVYFKLIGGPTQGTLTELGPNIGPVDGNAGTYAWEVPCDAGDKALYGLKVLLQSNTNIMQYSMPFHITPKDDDDDDDDTSSTAAPTMPTPSHNTTMTTMTTSHPPVDTTSIHMNGTMTTHKPSTTVTRTTFAPDTPAPSATGSPAPTATAGASRVMGGSFAAVAVAAFFFGL